MLATFDTLLRFCFFKMLDRSELNFLLIDHLFTCPPLTKRQKITTWWFCQNWLVLELPERTIRQISYKYHSNVRRILRNEAYSGQVLGKFQANPGQMIYISQVNPSEMSGISQAQLRLANWKIVTMIEMALNEILVLEE